MRRMAASLLAVMAAMLFLPYAAPAQQPQIAHTNLKVGDMAPDFTLKGTHRGKKNVILAFYVLAFTGG